MFEKDYYMRMIHEFARTLLKLLFDIDEEKEEIILEDAVVNKKYQKLILMLKQGEINEAENQLYKELNLENREELKMGLMFYEYLNSFTREELENCNYEAEEIKDGIYSLLEKFGYEGLANALR